MYNLIYKMANQLKKGDEFYPPSHGFAGPKVIDKIKIGQYGGLQAKCRSRPWNGKIGKMIKVNLKPDQIVRVIERPEKPSLSKE